MKIELLKDALSEGILYPKGDTCEFIGNEVIHNDVMHLYAYQLFYPLIINTDGAKIIDDSGWLMRPCACSFKQWKPSGLTDQPKPGGG